MEGLLVLIGAVALLILLDIGAITFGEDTRDGFDDDCRPTGLS